jgi:tetratricopeptide (TPR) repeat protein
MLLYKKLLGSIVVLVLVFSACPAPAQEAIWEDHSRAGQEALTKGDYTSAEQHFMAAIRAAKMLNPEDPRIGVSLNDLAQVYRARGKYKDAEAIHEEAVQILTLR